MKKAHKIYNKNPTVFTDLRQKLKLMFPQENMKVGIHTDVSSLYSIGYAKNLSMHAVSACIEVEKDNVNLRIFRSGSNGPTYKIDMISGVNKKVSCIIPKLEFDHYIYTDIPENIMSRNNISIKFVIDKEGNFVPKINDNGMLEAFINFPDPYEQARSNQKR